MLLPLSSQWMLPLANLSSQLMFAAGVGLLTMILLRKSYKQLGKRRKGMNNKAIEKQPRPTSAWSGAHQDADARLSRQEVEFHESTRDMNGRLDSKMILLQELIVKSQQQIDRLEELMDETDSKSS